MAFDPEIIVMEKVLEEYKSLGQDQRIRITKWLSARYNMRFILPDGETGPKNVTETTEAGAAQNAETPAPAEPVAETAPVEAGKADVADEPSNTREITAFEPAENNFPVEPIPAASRSLDAYDTLEQLFQVVQPRRVGGRILLAAAYLQEKKNLNELTSLDINRALKNIGKGVPNITLAINRMVDKIPQLLTVTRKDGDTKQGRRNFKVTEEGIKQARNFIKMY